MFDFKEILSSGSGPYLQSLGFVFSISKWQKSNQRKKLMTKFFEIFEIFRFLKFLSFFGKSMKNLKNHEKIGKISKKS